jgi:hypothetical protein
LFEGDQVSKENTKRRVNEKKKPQKTLKEKRMDKKANANGGTAHLTT